MKEKDVEEILTETAVEPTNNDLDSRGNLDVSFRMEGIL